MFRISLILHKKDTHTHTHTHTLAVRMPLTPKEVDRFK